MSQRVKGFSSSRGCPVEDFFPFSAFLATQREARAAARGPLYEEFCQRTRLDLGLYPIRHPLPPRPPPPALWLFTACFIKVLPEIVLTLSMILLLLATADRTLRKGVKAFKKESNLKVRAAKAGRQEQGNMKTLGAHAIIVSRFPDVERMGNPIKPPRVLAQYVCGVFNICVETRLCVFVSKPVCRADP